MGGVGGGPRPPFRLLRDLEGEEEESDFGLASPASGGMDSGGGRGGMEISAKKMGSGPIWRWDLYYIYTDQFGRWDVAGCRLFARDVRLGRGRARGLRHTALAREGRESFSYKVGKCAKVEAKSLLGPRLLIFEFPYLSEN